MRLFAGFFAICCCFPFLFAKETTIPLDQVSVLTSPELSSLTRSNEEESKVIKQNLIDAMTGALDRGSELQWFGNEQRWKMVTKLKEPKKDQPVILKFRISTNRFTQGSLKIEGLENNTLYVNGQEVSGKGPFKLELQNVDYRVMLISTQISAWDSLKLSWISDDDDPAPQFLADSGALRLTPEVLYDSETISQISLSPDASLLFWVKRSYSARTKDTPVSVAELLHPDSMEVVYRWQAMTPESVVWSDNNLNLAYAHDDSIFVLDRTNFKISEVATQVKGASVLNWLDANTLLFSWNQPAKEDKGFTKRYQSLEDRWSYWRDRSQIFKLDVHSGFIKQVTQNEMSSDFLDVDAKNHRLLVSRNPVNYKQPPHTITQLVEVNLDTLEENMIGEFRTFSSAAYHPNGMVISAGPSFHQNAGRSIKEGKPVNDYDSQLYLRGADGKVTPLSKDFKPSINRFRVLENGDLILTATDQDRVQLFTFSFKTGQFQPVSSDIEVVESFSASKQANPLVVFKGTSATYPQRVYITEPGFKATNLIYDSGVISYSNRVQIVMKDWDYKTKNGHDVEGRYYLPPGFDSEKSYPTIVYYYGGTSPVTRDFTGRWPYVLWASQGYVVYVLQPSGATGFGQEFSARHVNAWGLETADDIIESTKAFVKAHSFVDGKRLGNMGASYGGFMTMYLATKTDLFRASISHAGISNLTSYWGHGWWGYDYSGVATRGRFPWNAAEFYTDQSPVFHADKVKTPLLLIHGDSDTNVPVGESHQMYTALKLLGKDVELVEFHGDNHHINARTHRLRWWSTILSYFDRELKGQPQWWDHLYSDK